MNQNSPPPPSIYSVTNNVNFLYTNASVMKKFKKKYFPNFISTCKTGSYV